MKRVKEEDGDKEKNGEEMSLKKAKDIFGREIKALGVWSSKGRDLLVFTHASIEHRNCIAAFDMDGTIITTKSGHVFPKDTSDWKFLDESVVPRLRDAHEKESKKLVIFTNQKGLQNGKVQLPDFKRKIETIVKKIGVPVQVFISIGDGVYRKPMTAMWTHLVEEANGGVEVFQEKSLYVGDAAGRHQTKRRPKKDHSAADRFFAANIGLEFKTPEQYFFNDPKEEPWGPPNFDARTFLAKELPPFEPENTVLPAENPELLVLVGFPGSGKSTFARRIADKYGYAVVNRDTLGTWQKCVDAARSALREGKSVIVDNTNPDKASRKRYTDLAKEQNVTCRCFELNAGYHHALHNVKFRMLVAKGPHTEVSAMVLRMHQSKFEKPSLDEGFDALARVNFVPDFESDEQRKLYASFLIDA